MEHYIPAKRSRKIFYVYALFDECGIVRYIGKGKEDRWEDHEKTHKSRNYRKKSFIKRTLKALDEVPKIKIRQGLTETYALEIEVALIKAIGRLDLKTGPLTNMSDGGNGGDLGIYVKQAKAKWTDEERERHGQTYRKAIKAAWDAQTPEEKQAKIKITLTTAHIKMKYLRETDPTFQVKIAEKIRDSHAKRTPEQKAEAARKALETNPPEARSEAARLWHASRTAEDRSETISKGWRDQTPEERSQRARGPNFDHEKRSAQVRYQQANLTPKQQIERDQRARALGKNTRWINDGKVNKRLKNIQRLPTGWVYGKIPRTS